VALLCGSSLPDCGVIEKGGGIRPCETLATLLPGGEKKVLRSNLSLAGLFVRADSEHGKDNMLIQGPEWFLLPFPIHPIRLIQIAFTLR
jgi:hypothetical protein